MSKRAIRKRRHRSKPQWSAMSPRQQADALDFGTPYVAQAEGARGA